MGKKPIVLIAIATFVAIIAYGYLSVIDTTPRRANADNAQLVAAGKVAYDTHCASCHGANLEGQANWRQKNPDGTLPAPPHDVSGHTWHHPDDLLFKITKNGGASIAPPGFKSAMPAFGAALTDGDIWAVLSYIKSTWPANIRDRQNALNN